MRPSLIRVFLAIVAIFAALLTPVPLASQEDSEEIAILVVNSTADVAIGECGATCTLRDALLHTNAEALPHRVTFDLPPGAGGLAIIAVSSPLPPLEVPGTILDGTTQPGYAGRPLVYLDGTTASKASGIVATAPDIEVRGLAVGNFDRYGIAAIGEEADRARFIGNWSGLAPDGWSAAPNRLSGIAVLAGAGDARIGDACEGCGNRVAGNSNPQRTGHGVLIGGVGAVGTRVSNNWIGIDIGGNALPNDDGVLIVDGAHATVGGRSVALGNVISGNRVAGIEVRDSNFLTMRIESNRIGLDPTGTRAVPNDVGLFINAASGNITVGAAVASAANVISGNRVGVAIETLAHDIVVQGNVIGLDAAGRRAIPNTEDGISIVAGARDITIGGTAPGEGNHIVGSMTGIVIVDQGTANVVVAGNTLGLALDGRTAVPNAIGISVLEATAVEIGGRDDGAGNWIVATTGAAVVLDGVSRADVRGNRIGLAPDDMPLGNGIGVVLRGASVDNQVQQNVFAGNVEAGIQVVGAAAARNRLTRNVFLTAPGIPIDLGGEGLTPNDPEDLDAGPNALLNTPVITELIRDGRAATVHGTGPVGQRVEVYRIRSLQYPDVEAHSSGSGGGVELLGTGWVNQDGFWEARFVIPVGEPITAISVSGSGNTSEFAQNFVPLPPEFLSAGFTATAWFGPETPVAEALAVVGDRLQVVFRFEAESQTWSAFRPGLPFLSTFDTLRAGDAIWVLLNAGSGLFWPQAGLAAGIDARVIELAVPLNFSTWTGPATPIADALATALDEVETVFRWDRGERRFELIFPVLSIVSTPPLLQPHDILWLRLTRPASWPQPPN